MYCFYIWIRKSIRIDPKSLKDFIANQFRFGVIIYQLRHDSCADEPDSGD